jgi:RNA polymerase sigma factor
VELLILVLLKRFLGKSPTHSSRQISPEELVRDIQQGDTRLRNQFITDYQPYVAKVTSRFCKRYVDPARDDEFAVALSAFNEAINQFSHQAGRSFLSFAETVIRRRLIDFVRKEQRFNQQVPYSSFEVEDEEENMVNPVEVHQAIREYEQQKDMEERRSEIMELNRVLGEFDIRFSDLVDASPKHVDSRESITGIGVMLASDSSLMRILLSKRMLPIKELLELTNVSRKTLERNRKYIIAIAIIYNGPYPYLRDYLKFAKPEEDGGMLS